MDDRQRVAAVCWRPGPAEEPEFLLVRTVAGDRWTFPKGGLEPEDATPGEGAKREAREEAGVEGVAARAPLRAYIHVAQLASGRSRDQLVEAWLVRVTGTAGEPEPGRQPSWFAASAAARALAENQSGPAAVAELHDVLAEAVRVIAAAGG